MQQLTAKQKNQLLELFGVYVGNMAVGHAKVKITEVKKHLKATYFGWMGQTDENSVFY